MVSIQNRPMDYLGTPPGFEEVAELGIFSKRTGDGLLILIPGDESTTEVLVSQF